MRPSKYFYDKPLPKYLDPKTVLIYRPPPVYVYFVVKRQGGELWQRLAGKKDTITVRARTTEKAFKVNVNKLNKILKDNFFSSHLLDK
jgi:hypothetical protein